MIEKYDFENELSTETFNENLYIKEVIDGLIGKDRCDFCYYSLSEGVDANLGLVGIGCGELKISDILSRPHEFVKLDILSCIDSLGIYKAWYQDYYWKARIVDRKPLNWGLSLYSFVKDIKGKKDPETLMKLYTACWYIENYVDEDLPSPRS